MLLDTEQLGPELIDWSNPVNLAHPLARGLVAWWLAVPGFQGWGSIRWRDMLIGAEGTLTAMTPATEWVGVNGSAFGGALDFKGTDDRVTIAHQDAFNVVAPFTLALWVRYTTTANTVIFEKNGNNGFSVQTLSGGAAGGLGFRIGSIARNATGTFNDAVGRLFIFTADASGTAIYVDGQLNATGGAVSDPSYGTNTPIYCGSRNGGAEFTGQGDCFAIYSRYFLASDARAYYNLFRQQFPRLINRVSLARMASTQDEGGGEEPTLPAGSLALLGVGI